MRLSQELSFFDRPSRRNMRPMMASALASSQYRENPRWANQTAMGRNSSPNMTSVARNRQPVLDVRAMSAPPESRGDDAVQSDQRHAFEPDRLAVDDDDRRRERRQQQGGDEQRWQDQRQHRAAQEEREQHESG